MATTLDDAAITRYFQDEDFCESQVIALTLGGPEGPLRLTLRFANITGIERQMAAGTWPPPEASPSDFRHLSFEGVSALKRIKVRYRQGFRGFDRHCLEYHCRDSFSEALQSVELRKCPAGFEIQLGMGSWGTYQFEFERLTIRQRLGMRSRPGLREGEYVDISTQRVFDFYQPFSE